MNKPNLIVFTDLDGTLLDHFTYSWEQAQPALNLLFLLKIPIIPCTSKTKEETVYYRGQLGLEHPFIIENGAAIYSPMGYFDNPISEKTEGGYEVKEFGVPYSELRGFLQRCKKDLKLNLNGFGDLETDEIQEVSGLTFHLAELARRRKYSEPFYFLDKKSGAKLAEIEKTALKHHVKITKGGRFYHLSGPHNKGLSVKTLSDFFRREQSGKIVLIGIGDSLNDLSMLQQVDIPCLVKNGRGNYNQDILEKISPRLAEEVGPKGWNKVVMEILDEYKLKPKKH